MNYIIKTFSMMILFNACLPLCMATGEATWEETTVYGGKTSRGRVRINKTVINSYSRENGESVKRQTTVTTVKVKTDEGWKESTTVDTKKVDKFESVKMNNKIVKKIIDGQEKSTSEE